MATRSISQLDTTDVAAEFDTLAAQLTAAFLAEREAQAHLIAIVSKARAEGERQQRELSR